MNKIIMILALALILVQGCVPVEECNCPPVVTCPTCPSCVSSIYAKFCPVEDCLGEIVTAIDSSQHSIVLSIYSLTHDDIGDALVRASERGVDVKVLMEFQQISQYSEAQKLIDVGIPVRKDSNSGYMHNKYMVIDGVIVLTGSVNYSENGVSRNNENLVVIHDTTLAQKYTADFNRLWQDGIDWVG